MNLPSHLVLRHSTYYFRLKIPQHLQAKTGRKVIKQSLGTGNTCLAKQQAYRLYAGFCEAFRLIAMADNPDINKILQRAREGRISRFEIDQFPNGQPFIKRAEPGEDWNNAQMALSSAIQAYKEAPSQPYKSDPWGPSPQAPITPDKLLSEAIDWYAKKKQSVIKADTLLKYTKVQTEFLEHLGDYSVSSIYRHHLDQFREHLQFDKGNTVPTIKNKFSAIKLLFAELINSGFYTQGNPAEGQISYGPKQKKQRSREQGRVAFTEQQLAVVFKPETYPTNSPSEFWVPLLQLYTGARANEICQLTVADFKEVEGFHCVAITDDQAGTSLKTEASRRTIPLHKNLLDIGLLDYLEAVSKAGYARVFPHLKKTKNNYSGRQRKAFTRHLEKLGLEPVATRLASHSFRKAVVQKLQDKKISGEVRRDFIGHSGTEDYKEDSHSISYARQSKISELASIVLPALDFPINTEALKAKQLAQVFITYLNKTVDN